MKGFTIVLGGNGLIGRKLLPLLRGAGVQVKSAGRSAAEIRFNWNDQSTFRPALSGARSLYLVPPAMLARPAPAVTELLEAAKDAGIARVVAVSSLGVTFPTEPSGSGRLEYEAVVRASGLDWSILRPSGFMQNFSEGFMLPTIRNAGVVTSAAGFGKVAMVDTADIASVAFALLTRDDYIAKVLELTGPQTHDFVEMAAIISAASRRAIRYQPVEEPQMEQMMRAAGIPADYASILLDDQRAIREGSAAVVTSDVRDIVDREPTRFDEFAQANASAWRSTGR